MNTEQTDSGRQDSRAWAAGFRARAASSRIPVTAMLELTSRCNLRCRHCYLGDQADQGEKRERERSTEQVKASLKEWAEAGCLYLTITGGDPMVRKDFAEIYRAACELGLLVTVFCDGILVDDSIVQLFSEYPPLLVEISVYGATQETYERVTRVPGSYARAWTGIRRLHANGIRVGLKTMLMTLNEHEWAAMENQAAEAGLAFRFDAAVFPCLPEASNGPLSLRVSPEKVVKHDAANVERLEKWADNVAVQRERPESESLYQCGAGRTAFYADPYGALSPCLMTIQYRYDAKGRSFNDVWLNDLGKICRRKRTKNGGSLVGPMRGACSHCPAMNYIETGNEETEAAYMREIARLRYKTILSKISREKPHEQ